MTSADAVLRNAATHGSLDSAEWPKVLQYILDRLDEIINEFPAPPVANDPSKPDPRATDTDKAPSSLPQDIADLYASIRTTLATNFAKNPPHTAQRLAELVLEPTRSYRYLPSYLHALDRVVSVSSPLSLFPLPQAVLPTSGSLLNGTASTNPATATLGSDESLGGALLTPIPWLQSRGQSELISESTEIVDGPNGAGRIETVTVGMLTSTQSRPDVTVPSSPVAQIASSHPDGETLPSTGPVTQGELLRQEQEAGVVLNNPHTLTSPTRTSFTDMPGAGIIIDTVEADEEVPHARGPELIGMEDTGPQKESKGMNIEAAIGRPSLGDKTSPDPAQKEPDKEGNIVEGQKIEGKQSNEAQQSAKNEGGGADVSMKEDRPAI